MPKVRLAPLETATLFSAQVPDAHGQCPDGTDAVFRAYNNGIGGAPNHRFSTDGGAMDAVVDKGWVREGIVLCAAR